MNKNYQEQFTQEIQAIFQAYPGVNQDIIQIFLQECDYIVRGNLIELFIAKYGFPEFQTRVKRFLDNPSAQYAESLADCLATMVYDD